MTMSLWPVAIVYAIPAAQTRCESPAVARRNDGQIGPAPRCGRTGRRPPRDLAGRVGITSLHRRDIGQGSGVELDLGRGDVLFQLRHRRRADDRRPKEPAALHVTERELHERDAALLREVCVCLSGLAHPRLAEAYTQPIDTG